MARRHVVKKRGEYKLCPASPLTGCAYWVSPREAHCPNCGVVFEADGRLVFDQTPGLWEYLWKQVRGDLRRKWQMLHLERIESSLLNDEGLVNGRIRSLEHQLEMIDQVELDSRKIKDRNRKQAIQENVEYSLYTTWNLLHEYEDKLRYLQLIRWHNVVKTIYDDRLDLESDDYQERLKSLDIQRKRGESMLKAWTSNLRSMHPAGGWGDEYITFSESRYGKRLFKKWRKEIVNLPMPDTVQKFRHALDACHALREDLLMLQVGAISRSLTHFETPLATVPSTGRYEVDIFNEFVHLDMFHQGLADIENQFSRLKSEVELKSDLGTW